MVRQDLHLIKLKIPRIFYVNHRVPKDEEKKPDEVVWRKVAKILPRSHPCHHLYEYIITEEDFRKHSADLMEDISSPEIEGIYETRVNKEFTLLFRTFERKSSQGFSNDNPVSA